MMKVSLLSTKYLCEGQESSLEIKQVQWIFVICHLEDSRFALQKTFVNSETLGNKENTY